MNTFEFTNSWKEKDPPFVAIITETNACDSVENVLKTLDTLSQILGDNNRQNVDLIVIRVTDPKVANETASQEHDFHTRLVQLTKGVVQLKRQVYSQPSPHLFHPFSVVVNDHVQAAMEGNADGVHVKEHKVDSIPSIRSEWCSTRSVKREEVDDDDDDEGGGRGSTLDHTSESKHPILIGTSTHNISSAIQTWKLYKPDYFFVGTCYMTTSHPEKNQQEDLEGPLLPGECKAAMENHERLAITIPSTRSSEIMETPIIFAIGGINEDNCHEPFCYGADGVAVIKCAMQALDPSFVISRMKRNMMMKKKKIQKKKEL